MLKTPILFIIFNRPDTTFRVFETIKMAKPSRLYIAADGPRKTHSDDLNLCNDARKVIDLIDWSCDIYTKLSDENLGCGKSVSSAITWFFETEQEGIILEDDCLPHLDFFFYCQELLDVYRENSFIGMISGNNFQNGKSRNNFSYYFSQYGSIWGWATWKRTWEKFNLRICIESFDTVNLSISKIFSSKSEIVYWMKIASLMKNSKIDSWAYPFTFCLWINNLLSIVPNTNLVTNIGFDARGTHTKDPKNISSDIPSAPILPIIHTTLCKVDKKADRYYFQTFINSKNPISTKDLIKEFLYRFAPKKIRNLYKTIKSIYYNIKQ